jgi:RNA polymerase sigma factor (sigma-70 family)
MIPDDTTLARLMGLSQQGDAEAYRTVLVAVQAWLRRYYHGRIVPSQIDDLVQETLTSLHLKRATFDATRPFMPWLAAIARYRWIDQLRRTYRQQETALDDDVATDGDDEAILSRLSLDTLLRSLPDKQAGVIRLVKIEGHTIADAALRSGQSESLVKVNIHRGLKRLAALVESDGR